MLLSKPAQPVRANASSLTLSDQFLTPESSARQNPPLRQLLHIGRILRAHGLRGEVKILSLSSDPDRFENLHECLLVSADEKIIQTIQIESARSNQEQIILKLKGVDDRNQAETMRGRFLSVNRENAAVLPPDHWFICDLIGCEVFDENEGALGVLTDVMQNAAQDVYTVHQTGQTDILFPALKSILLKVDIPGRRIDVRLSNGLYEVYRGRKT